MEWWFKLFEEWIGTKGYYHCDIGRKELWQLFCMDIRRAWGMKDDEKIHWFKLNLNDTARKIGCTYTNKDGWRTADSGLSAAFSWRILPEEEYDKYKK